MGVEIALASILALGGAGIYLGLKTLENYSPGRKKIQKDLQKLKAELAPLASDLVPINQEEMEQLSFNADNKSIKKRVVKNAKGVFTTVYHEPLIAWIYRKYVSSKENSVIYTKTSKFELTYRTKKGVTEVVMNERLIGSIDSTGALRAKGKKAPIALIKQVNSDAYFPILVNGKEMGGLTDPLKSEQMNPRAFQLLHNMNQEEELLFLIVAIHSMVKMSI